jgi:hypothetical protein
MARFWNPGACVTGLTPTVSSRDTAVESPPVAHSRRSRLRSSASCRMPRESRDAPEDLPKQALRQVAPGQLEPEVPGTHAGLVEGGRQRRGEADVPGPASSCLRLIGNQEASGSDCLR